MEILYLIIKKASSHFKKMSYLMSNYYNNYNKNNVSINKRPNLNYYPTNSKPPSYSIKKDPKY